jgi:hypothetical protein
MIGRRVAAAPRGPGRLPGRALAAATLVLSSLLLAAAARAQAPGERSALPPRDCDRSCLIDTVHDYLSALKARSTASLKLAPDVRYTENNVEMPLGHEGIWATVTGVAPTGLEAADVQQGEVAWIGTVEEHGAPVYYGMRLQVLDRRIAEVEAVVVRNSGLPLPWGDVSQLEHDPAFADPLPEASRRPRERLRAVADSYFNTVELNDGTVFAPFHEDCARIENGISTTRASATAGPGGAGNASSISPGCEAQFRLGIYYINKRVRERRYPVIDEERGVVVATGFFDHANGFDRYRLTDGREMRTALKWPNSISLFEAFKVVDGKIYRIETVFSYVPYFMPSPYYPHPRPAPAAQQSPVAAAPCGEACLLEVADRTVAALAARRPGEIPWAARVRYSENGVSMQVGDGLWASIRGVAPGALRVADPRSGQVAWYGLVFDHDAPAYAGLRIKVEAGRVAEVEAVVARERNPGPWLPPAQFRIDPAFTAMLPAAERSTRRALIKAVEGYAQTLERNDGHLFVGFDRECQRRENGLPVTAGSGGSAVIAAAAGSVVEGCEAPLKLGLYRPLERLRNRRYPVVDEARGLVVAQSLADFPLRETRYRTSDGVERETAVRYPSTREFFEIYRIRAGRIQRVDAVSVFQPYRMPSPWR